MTNFMGFGVSALEVIFNIMRNINSRFTYLLTYFETKNWIKLGGGF